MEWIDALQGEVMGLDTAPLIYFIEENPTYVIIADSLSVREVILLEK